MALTSGGARFELQRCRNGLERTEVDMKELLLKYVDDPMPEAEQIRMCELKVERAEWKDSELHYFNHSKSTAAEEVQEWDTRFRKNLARLKREQTRFFKKLKKMDADQISCFIAREVAGECDTGLRLCTNGFIEAINALNEVKEEHRRRR